jgi:hypothetical protein
LKFVIKLNSRNMNTKPSTCNKKLVVQPLRGLDAFSAPQQKR